MLGKGLESLIPKNNNQSQGSGTALPDGAPARSDNFLPGRPVEQALPPQATPPTFQPQPQPQPRPSFVPPVQPVTQSVQQPVVQPQKRDDLAQESIFHIEIEKITPNPDQPRRHFDQDALHELASSIREFGFLQPLVVSKVERETSTGIAVTYQIIAGERRFHGGEDARASARSRDRA